MESVEQRLAVLTTVLADPPPVHVDLDPPDGRVWSTERDCYEFLARECRLGARTLETGLGISTVLFASWGCKHECVVPSEAEIDRCIAYLDERSVGRNDVRFHVGYSEDVLPKLEPSPLDLVFVDGGHGFPIALIDWFYGASRLVAGGCLVLDDIQLPSVRLGLLEYLDRDPRWEQLHRGWKWGAWRRLSEGPLAEQHGAQTFLGPPASPPRRAAWLPEPLRPLVRGAYRTLSRKAPRSST